ncbi:MAG: histidinol dehydrogenase, partial [Rhodothermales bacterium]|nr:histidinol dehydrogenase [Rhodothermales bacterium]
GAARAYSGVAVESFMNRITFQELSADGLQELGPSVMALAHAEGLEGHRRSVGVRLATVSS